MTDVSRAPLVVDFDGTLIKEESHSVLMRRALLSSFSGCFRGGGIFVRSGRSALKHFCAESVSPLPVWTVRDDLVRWLRAEKAIGCPLYLATGAPERVVQVVVDPLNLFDAVWTSTYKHNLVGPNKAAFLTDTFPRGFDYVGNSWQDRPVWRTCRHAYLVTTSRSLQRWAKRTLLQCSVWRGGNFMPLTDD